MHVCVQVCTVMTALEKSYWLWGLQPGKMPLATQLLASSRCNRKHASSQDSPSQTSGQTLAYCLPELVTPPLPFRPLCASPHEAMMTLAPPIP